MSFLPLALETLDNAESGKEDDREGVIEGDKEAVLRVEREQEALVKEVFIVVKSASPHYLLVGGVNLSNHHIEENPSTHQTEGHQREMCGRVGRLEKHPSYRGLYQRFETRVDS